MSDAIAKRTTAILLIPAIAYTAWVAILILT